ncbi:uromodulin-like isoform X1 [Acropora muricata]|uniref:uromodulin-like isoform X1 n=1 Tax=Acropora muricata TaxID=159855 RepID=UPI0034E4CE8E
MVKKLYRYATAVLFLTSCISLQACADNLQCKHVRSIYGMMLRDHVFQEHNAANLLTCGQLCNSNLRCQSVNYVISRQLCELNSRTKEARPEDYVQDADRVYLTKPGERVPLGSIQEVPATSCKEIKSSEGTSAVSGNYWLDSIKPGQAVLVVCDMRTGDIDECASGTHNCIREKAICTNALGSYKCTCKSGYRGDGLNYCIPDECQNYQVLSNADRKVTTVNALLLCDRSLGPAWFRFQGDAGTKMPTSCISRNRCGTHAAGWLNGAHPEENDGKVTRQVCFSFSTCCTWSVNIQVKNCSGYYLYYIHGTHPGQQCHLRYCSTD